MSTNFQTFFESIDLDDYYHQLDVYLQRSRGWRIAPITSETHGGVVSKGYYNIIDNTGATLGRDREIGKIKRKYNRRTNTLELEHISAAFDDTGLKRIKGLGIVDTVYPFDVKFVINNNIQRVVIDAVSSVTKKKFTDHFTRAGFAVAKQGNKLVATHAQETV
jgi:hypothetical protein